MKKTRVVSAVFTLLALLMLGVVVQAGSDKAKEVTLSGEVLDLHCYMLHPETGQGADHAKCANSCIKRGLPSGFLSDGQVYLLLGPGHDSAGKVVEGHAGHPVELTGKLVDHHGMRAIQISTLNVAPGGIEKHKGHDHGDGSGHDHNH